MTQDLSWDKSAKHYQRMYMDIAAFIMYFGNELDWDYIQRELEILCFKDFANMVLTVVRECFGVESPISLHQIEDQVFEDFMEFTMAAGTFGYVGRDPGVIQLKKQDPSVQSVSRVQTLWARLFAPASELEKRYTYLRGRHWLLPAAWIHRLLRTRGKWR